MDRHEHDMSEIKESYARLETRFETRMDRHEHDISLIKSFFARELAMRLVDVFTDEIGLEYVRNLPRSDLRRMVKAADPPLPPNEAASFRRADLVIEARDESGIVYIALEVSYTADLRDSRRASRNAQFLARATGHRAVPAIGSVRNVNEVAELVDSGEIHWLEIEEPRIESD